ncbi:hypothetical protein RO3G_15314 [Rhizopus delemar RA 99-880]|uniref:Uncharacterized protein n=1 Tax=Rhizopus delemar (strain RA 99-880 / ATCC MYA-4621 / FGSC 9543 / NRRL 43880) TaxID=246409 RepID=I1CQ73_RHIO9|nr:hypothetical protein RO3G_15314 [Rhizopus delemar RA 99-880]|eukprot:EIE90603.1 hypothetical protein RO3G_15314 [Rhizopus delemar RA 99-880]
MQQLQFLLIILLLVMRSSLETLLVHTLILYTMIHTPGRFLMD